METIALLFADWLDLVGNEKFVEDEGKGGFFLKEAWPWHQTCMEELAEGQESLSGVEKADTGHGAGLPGGSTSPPSSPPPYTLVATSIGQPQPRPAGESQGKGLLVIGCTLRAIP